MPNTVCLSSCPAFGYAYHLEVPRLEQKQVELEQERDQLEKERDKFKKDREELAEVNGEIMKEALIERKANWDMQRAVLDQNQDGVVAELITINTSISKGWHLMKTSYNFQLQRLQDKATEDRVMIRQLQTKSDQQEDKIAAQDLEIIGLKEKVAEQELEITGLKQNVAEQKQEIGGLKEKVVAQDREIGELKSRVDSLVMQVENLMVALGPRKVVEEQPAKKENAGA